MDIQQRIQTQRIQHIIDSYLLQGNYESGSNGADDGLGATDIRSFETYLDELLTQYPHGLIELALVETLIKSWLNFPMEKGVPFLSAAHHRLKAWTENTFTLTFTPSQFTQITGLDARSAFESLIKPSQNSPKAMADFPQ
ncbi:MAG: hypothetical protein AAFR58_07770 [Cyanobacteria bacterium J06627_28]